MNNNDIETLSVLTVKESLIQSGFLEPFINENDKQPSWDGEVNIYSEKSKTKEYFTGRMPVQVKGKLSKDLSKKEISYTSNKKDLKNYLYDGGIIFFVVYINESNNQKKIYYEELTPIKLRTIIKSIKKEKKNIKLFEFPNDPLKKASIFLNCYNHCQKQTSFSNANLLTVEELEDLGMLESITTTISGYSLERENPYKLFLDVKDHYFYANIKGSAIPQPLELDPSKLSISRDIMAKIKVDGKLYYENFTQIYSKGKITNNIGESIKIIVNTEDSKTQIKYNESSFLRKAVEDLEFTLAFIDYGQIEFDDNILPIQYSDKDLSNFDIEKQKLKLAYFKKIVNLLDSLRAFEDLDLSKLSIEEWHEIDHLIEAFVNKKPVENLKPNLPQILNLQIGDLNFILVFSHVPDKEGTYEISDFFEKEIKMFNILDDKSRLVTSQYLFLSVENLYKTSNINYSVFLPSFQELEDHEQKYIQANNFLLKLLLAYDYERGMKQALLKTADDFSRWLLEADNEYLIYNVRLLNWLQVKRRQRELTTKEKDELLHIIETSKVEDEIVGAYILLDYQEAARKHFDNLEPERQEVFKSYPIYKFYTQEKSS